MRPYGVISRQWVRWTEYVGVYGYFAGIHDQWNNEMSFVNYAVLCQKAFFTNME